VDEKLGALIKLTNASQAVPDTKETAERNCTVPYSISTKDKIAKVSQLLIEEHRKGKDLREIEGWLTCLLLVSQQSKLRTGEQEILRDPTRPLMPCEEVELSVTKPSLRNNVEAVGEQAEGLGAD
jgi:hypothetical protein